MCIYNMFIYYFWLHWISVAVQAFSSCSKGGLLSQCGVRTSHCGGFCACRAWALLWGAWLSVVVACGLSGCSFWAVGA